MLSLTKAKKGGLLDEFIREQEAIGIGPAREATFDLAASKIVRTSQQSGQTSRSPSPGYLIGE